MRDYLSCGFWNEIYYSKQCFISTFRSVFFGSNRIELEIIKTCVFWTGLRKIFSYANF
jgi:hypothetical protein